MSHIDDLVRVTSGPIRLQPNWQPSSNSVTRDRVSIRSLPVNAHVQWDGGSVVEISPMWRTSEDADVHCERLAECCDVAEALRESFGGEWRMELGDVEYMPCVGSDYRAVERAAVHAFGIRGMHARAL